MRVKGRINSGKFKIPENSPISPYLPLKSFQNEPIVNKNKQNKGLLCQNKKNRFPPKIAIIIGGGYSIKEEGIPLGLWDKIKNKFTIGCNENRKHFNATLNTLVDYEYFDRNKDEIFKLPLVIGKGHGDSTKETKNFFVFKSSPNYYGRDSFKKGKIYTARLTGIWSLTIGIACGAVELFCLGFDWTLRKGSKRDKDRRVLTHYFQKSYEKKPPGHKGIGMIKFYCNPENKPIKFFRPFLNESAKIYIVGKSNIKCFNNITYPEFFKKIKSSPNYNQPSLRSWIKKKIRQDRNN